MKYMNDQIKNEYEKKLADSKFIQPSEIEELNSLREEKTILKAKLDEAVENARKYQEEYIKSSTVIKTHLKIIKDREDMLNKKEEMLRTVPPKILDAGLKKTRDDAIIALHKSQKENSEMKERIKFLEMKDVEREKYIVDLKEVIENLKK